MKKLLLIVLAAFVFTACDQLANELENALSSFSATVSGDASSTFSGTAEFVHIKGQSTDPQTSSFTTVLENSENSEEYITLGVTISGSGDGVPEGTYTASIDNTDVVVYLWYENETSGYSYSIYDETNQIILTSVEGTKIKGSFNFTLTDAIQSGEVTVSGSFDAVGVTSTQ